MNAVERNLLTIFIYSAYQGSEFGLTLNSWLHKGSYKVACFQAKTYITGKIL